MPPVKKLALLIVMLGAIAAPTIAAPIEWDYRILETGLGGRMEFLLESPLRDIFTNALDPSPTVVLRTGLEGRVAAYFIDNLGFEIRGMALGYNSALTPGLSVVSSFPLYERKSVYLGLTGRYISLPPAPDPNARRVRTTIVSYGLAGAFGASYSDFNFMQSYKEIFPNYEFPQVQPGFGYYAYVEGRMYFISTLYLGLSLSFEQTFNSYTAPGGTETRMLDGRYLGLGLAIGVQL